MKGLEVNVLPLSDAIDNRDFRIDSEFYRKMPADNPRHCYVPIRNVLLEAQYGISIDMNQEGRGFEIYRMNEIEHMLCVEEVNKRADVPSEEAAPFILKHNDVLFNRTNSQAFVGRTGIYKEFGTEQRIFASYLIRLIPDTKQVLSEYLVAFLNSSLGECDVKRRARISINQSNVNAEEVRDVRIPLLSRTFQEGIAAAFDKAHEDIASGRKLCKVAETTLLSELGLSSWKPPEPLTYNRRARDVFAASRFDAEHFRPKFKSLLDKITKAGAVRLGDALSEPIHRGVGPEYSEDGEFLVINSQQVGKVQVELNDNRRTTREFVINKLNRKAIVRQHDVLFNSTGYITIGRSQCLLEKVDAIVDNHVAILRPQKELDPVYLACYLNAMPGQWQTERGWTGSSGQIELRPDVVVDYLIWNAPRPTQQRIRQLIESAHAARRRAHELLEQAKRAVEVAIEQDERAGLAVLKSASSS